MRRLSWTRPARDDLRDIDAFLMDRSPTVATAMLEAILTKARLLERFPAAGPVLGDTIRTLSILGTPYSLVYEVTAEAILILRIRHEREDWR